jgi:uncharacterized protein YbgA (DUF1722 family)/uncharacterized protein YbbK (DUF523 family)
METSIKVGVSSCLLGESVRYNGGHKQHHYITDILGRYFSLVPVCPEVGCGLPIPREALRLEGDPAAPRLLTSKSRVDLTAQMQAFCSVKVKELEEEDLCGFIFKKDSPSSGLFRVKVYNNGVAAKSGRGLFAAAVAQHFPLLPLEEEGRLNDPALRENFLERVFSYRRWKDFLANAPTPGRLVGFHAAHKLLMMAHSPEDYRQMGVLVAHDKELETAELFRRYQELLMSGLARPATTAKNTNVLHHIMGYFKKELTAEEKAELVEIIGHYHDHLLPLLVPLTLLKHYTRKYDLPSLRDQLYLSPHPAQLLLRNHV